MKKHNVEWWIGQGLSIYLGIACIGVSGKESKQGLTEAYENGWEIL